MHMYAYIDVYLSIYLSICISILLTDTQTLTHTHKHTHTHRQTDRMAHRQTDTPLVLSSRLVTLSAASICAIPKEDVRQCAGRSMPRESSRPTDAATLEVQGRDRGQRGGKREG